MTAVHRLFARWRGSRQDAVWPGSFSVVVLVACLLTTFVRHSACGEFPQFRGVDGQGHADASGLPTEWNAKQNVAWSTTIPGSGWSSPVIADGRVWLTTSDDRDRSLHVISIDCGTGRILNDITVFQRSVLGKNSFQEHARIAHTDPRGRPHLCPLRDTRYSLSLHVRRDSVDDAAAVLSPPRAGRVPGDVG